MIVAAAGDGPRDPSDPRDAMQRILLGLGRARFGMPDAAIVARIRAIAEIEELKRLCERILVVSRWCELFSDE